MLFLKELGEGKDFFLKMYNISFGYDASFLVFGISNLFGSERGIKNIYQKRNEVIAIVIIFIHEYLGIYFQKILIF